MRLWFKPQDEEGITPGLRPSAASSLAHLGLGVSLGVASLVCEITAAKAAPASPLCSALSRAFYKLTWF